MLKNIWLKIIMIVNNRRIREIQQEKEYYKDLLDKSSRISDALIYQGKIESLEREEKRIRERYERRSK